VGRRTIRSLTAAPQCGARTLTTDGRDTDVIVFGLGLGYRF